MKIIMFLTILIFFTAGCLQVEYGVDFPDDQKLKEAEIIFSGAPEVDGCGWLIKLGDHLYHPENLADHFKTENLPVSIEYIVTREVFRCGRGWASYKTIRIISRMLWCRLRLNSCMTMMPMGICVRPG